MKYFITAYSGEDYITETAKRKKLLATLILNGYCVKQVNGFYFIVESDDDINIDVDFAYYISDGIKKDDSEIIQEYLSTDSAEIIEWFRGKYPAHYTSLLRNTKSSLKKLIDLGK